ncbi:hypothetical protein COW46_01010 [Candidatus Gracilibacteria bacterium CG17_big_fil_post_rev_8_21_14_2_50_48_13]|nr:MAG: hypothetical protein COW46_01010 [Candidatus Gracilibacteria bacterium CG17_big_fil_post_rev_8_21_14_2_50_48_13]
MNLKHASLGALLLSATLLTSCIGQPAPTNSNVAEAPKNTLTLTKTSFTAGEDIVVTFATEATEKTAWIGVIPSATPHGSEETNDKADVSYVYLDGATSGTKTLKAPMTGGSFDLRLNDSDANGKELASVSFTVTAPVMDANPTTGSGVSITLGKTSYKAGEAIEATFTAPATLDPTAWIGLIPAETPHGTEPVNDAADKAYMYLNKKTSGSVTLTAPTEPGTYDLRLNESDAGGLELGASAPFTVE